MRSSVDSSTLTRPWCWFSIGVYLLILFNWDFYKLKLSKTLTSKYCSIEGFAKRIVWRMRRVRRKVIRATCSKFAMEISCGALKKSENNCHGNKLRIQQVISLGILPSEFLSLGCWSAVRNSTRYKMSTENGEKAIVHVFSSFVEILQSLQCKIFQYTLQSAN